MPNFDIKSIKHLREIVRGEETRKDRYRGSVIMASFNLDEEIGALLAAGWPDDDIIDYVVSCNPVLWALYWLRNPQKPAEPIMLFDYQKAIINCQHRFKLSRCGRQIGKTVCMCIDMIHSAVTNEHLRILYVAPYMSHVMTLVEQTLRPLINDVPEISSSIEKMQTHPYFAAKFRNGSIIEAMTAGTGSKKGTTIRGKSADRLYLDEMDYMGSDTMASVNAVMVSRPNSKLWVSSTPSGRREEFYHYAVDADSKFRCTDCQGRPKIVVNTGPRKAVTYAVGSPFHFPSHVSPMFTAETDDFYRKSYTEIQYQHEILAEWGEEQEGVFRNEDIDICMRMGRKVMIDHEGNEYESSYTYDDIQPNPACTYIMGIDWNGEARGVHICIVEYNPNPADINGLPPLMYRVARVEIITGEAFSEDGVVTRILELVRYYNIAHIYADEGYGSLYIEILKKSAMNVGMAYVGDIIRAISLQSSIDVYDPITREKVSKPMKPFMVNNAARIVENRRIILPECEDEKHRLIGQMREYLVISRNESGRPIYSKENEDTLTAFMMALLGFTSEYSDLTTLPGVNEVDVDSRSLVMRSADLVEPRSFTPVRSSNLFERYGVKKRQPVFTSVASSLNLPYRYTTSPNDEEHNGHHYSNNIGSRTGGQSINMRGRTIPKRRL